MSQWQTAGVVCEGESIDLDGINPWTCDWLPTGELPVELPHPTYPYQHHRMDVYRIEDSGTTIKFAAGEVSARVWAVYIRK